MQPEYRLRYDSSVQSKHSEGLIDINQVFENYKKHNAKISPLPLEQFTKIANDNSMELIQTIPEALNQRFLPFKDLHSGALTELKRSLQQSKLVWNNYSISLFPEVTQQDQRTEQLTNRQLQLYHNKETMKQIRERSKLQTEQSIVEVQKQLDKLNSAKNMKSYPSLQYKKQQQIQKNMKAHNQQVSEEELQLLEKINSNHTSIAMAQKQYVYAYRNEYNFWGPSSRDGSSMVSYDRKLFLYGGAGATRVEDMLFATVDRCNIINIVEFYKWQQVKLDEKPLAGYRVHHSASIYKHNMILFGGEIHTESSNQKVVSECNCDIRIISLISFDVKTFKQTGIQSPRKSHVGEVIGRQLLVHGGIDLKGTFLKDIILFDIVTQKWQMAIIDTNNYYPNGVAFHKGCPYIVNKSIEIYRGESDQRYLNQGIYFFGGSDKFGNYLDTFLRLNIFQKPLRFEEIQYKGKLPSINISQQVARSQHSFTLNEALQVIVLYGGKNDDLSEQGFLNDIYLFDLRAQAWIAVEQKGLQTVGRCGHSASCVETKIFIFGGYNYQGFVKSDLLVIELQSSEAQSLLQGDFSEPLPSNRNKEQLVSILKPSFTSRQKILEELNFQNMNSVVPMPRKSIIKKRLSIVEPARRFQSLVRQVTRTQTQIEQIKSHNN